MYVTPYAGVWIETGLVEGYKQKGLSHPTRVCGLKLPMAVEKEIWIKSHPTRVCGLKHDTGWSKGDCIGHTLRGCVD